MWGALVSALIALVANAKLQLSYRITPPGTRGPDMSSRGIDSAPGERPDEHVP